MSKQTKPLSREQKFAAKLAPIICAYAAGSAIEVRRNDTDGWVKISNQSDAGLFFAHANAGWELRIAPKPPKTKQARIALVNCAINGDRLEGLEGQVKEEAKIHEGWIPARIIVPKGQCESVSKHPAFVKWVSELFTITG